MGKYFIALAIFTMIIVNSCEHSTSNGDLIQRYPTQIHNTWYYNFSDETYLYGDNSNPDSLLLSKYSQLQVTVTDTGLSLGYRNNTYENVIEMTVQDLIYSYTSKQYYQNSGIEFKAVGYTYTEFTDWVYPKINSNKKFLTFEEVKALLRNFSLIPNEILKSDSLGFYGSPRVILKYPVRINSIWVELDFGDFYREKKVIGIENINFNGRLYPCYKIESSMNNYKLRIYDYINLQKGLMRRAIEIDSIGFTNPDNPAPYAWGYARSITELTNTNVNE